MNERIKQLAQQAREEFLELPTGYRPEQVGMHPQLMERFAELIVRECAEVGAYHGGNVRYLILNNFGLKQ